MALNTDEGIEKSILLMFWVYEQNYHNQKTGIAKS